MSTEGSTPRQFGPDHYVPVLKTLPGEFTALARTRSILRGRMTPLVEVANKQGDPKTVSSRSPLARVAEDIDEYVGGSDFFFLDFHADLPTKTIGTILHRVSGYGLPFVPVLNPDKPEQTKTMLGALRFDHGACVRVALTGRVRRTGQSVTQQLEDLLDVSGVSVQNCDLILDLGFIPQEPGYSAEDIRRALDEIEDIERCRNLVVVGTSIPETLAEIGHDTIGELTRHELLFWYQLRELQLRRQPTFGDYIVQAPQRPSGMGRPVANVRYTSGDRVLIARGHKLVKGDHQQYRSLCDRLAARGEFRGATFSWGDSEIAAYANGGTPPLGQQHWRAVGSSHHFEDAVDALAR